ncbi:hypothetical protein D3C81_1719890 [compost metagenome]
MLRRQLAPGAGGHAHHQRHRELPAGHVAQGGGGVHQRVEGEQAEVHRHHLDDRPHAAQRRTDAGGDEAQFGQRRVAHPLLAELVEQALGHREGAAVAADVLAHQEHPRVARQCLAHCFAQRLAVADAAHALPSGVYTSSSSDSTGSRLPASAQATAGSTSEAASASSAATPLASSRPSAISRAA